MRKDLPIASKEAIDKDQRVQLDNEIEVGFLRGHDGSSWVLGDSTPGLFKDFFKNISDVEKKLVLEPTKASKEDNLPPVRSKTQLILNAEKKPVTSEPAVTKAQPAKPKSAKPRDYREWEK